jgi:flagellar motility protein MotE (MotC chaperone)
MRIRLLPAAIGAMALLLAARLPGLLLPGHPPAVAGLVPPAQASAPSQPQPQPQPQPQAQPQRMPPPTPSPPEPTPEQRAERALLEGLRARRTELDAREQAAAAREMVLAAAERRLAQRIEELTALQQRLQAAGRTGSEREEAGWRQLVKLYEGMRPRDAAAIFDELDLPVLIQLVDRMREAKAAPVLGAMKPERARLLTAELARHRARPAN